MVDFYILIQKKCIFWLTFAERWLFCASITSWDERMYPFHLWYHPDDLQGILQAHHFSKLCGFPGQNPMPYKTETDAHAYVLSVFLDPFLTGIFFDLEMSRFFCFVMNDDCIKSWMSYNRV